MRLIRKLSATCYKMIIKLVLDQLASAQMAKNWRFPHRLTRHEASTQQQKFAGSYLVSRLT